MYVCSHLQDIVQGHIISMHIYMHVIMYIYILYVCHDKRFNFMISTCNDYMCVTIRSLQQLCGKSVYHNARQELDFIQKVLTYFVYLIASNYGRSCINAWSRLVARENSIITKINAGSQINAGSFVGSQ